MNYVNICDLPSINYINQICLNLKWKINISSCLETLKNSILWRKEEKCGVIHRTFVPLYLLSHFTKKFCSLSLSLTLLKIFVVSLPLFLSKVNRLLTKRLSTQARHGSIHGHSPLHQLPPLLTTPPQPVNMITKLPFVPYSHKLELVVPNGIFLIMCVISTKYVFVYVLMSKRKKSRMWWLLINKVQNLIFILRKGVIFSLMGCLVHIFWSL